MSNIEIKTPEQNIVNSFKGKKCLFLENDNILDNGLEEFEAILKANNIDYHVLFLLSEMDINTILDFIHKYDVIVFMTQWQTEISKKLEQYMWLLSEQGIKKDIVEVYIYEPRYFYKPDGIIHELYIYSCSKFFGETQKFTEYFYKLSETPYWDYTNKFDQ